MKKVQRGGSNTRNLIKETFTYLLELSEQFELNISVTNLVKGSDNLTISPAKLIGIRSLIVKLEL